MTHEAYKQKQRARRHSIKRDKMVKRMSVLIDKYEKRGDFEVIHDIKWLTR